MNGRFDIQTPMFEEALQTGEFRNYVVSLPDEALQKFWIVRHTVQDLGGGQAALK
jgi:hypothetical protein